MVCLLRIGLDSAPPDDNPETTSHSRTIYLGLTKSRIETMAVFASWVAVRWE